jgi:hypothetical protein
MPVKIRQYILGPESPTSFYSPYSILFLAQHICHTTKQTGLKATFKRYCHIDVSLPLHKSYINADRELEKRWGGGGSQVQKISRAGIFKQSRNRVGIGLSYRPARLHRLAELVPWNRFLGSIKVLTFALRIERFEG